MKAATHLMGLICAKGPARAIHLRFNRLDLNRGGIGLSPLLHKSEPGFMPVQPIRQLHARGGVTPDKP